MKALSECSEVQIIAQRKSRGNNCGTALSNLIYVWLESQKEMRE